MKRLFIDTEKLLELNPGDIKCEYLYHGENNGLLSIIEIAEFAVFCRQCPEAHCVKACPKDALERQPDGTVKRYNLRCVGCKSCVYACPFGTLFPETINYVTTHCDYCLEQMEKNPEYKPLCVESCPNGAIKFIEIEEENPEEGIFVVGKHLAVKSMNWRFKEGRVL